MERLERDAAVGGAVATSGRKEKRPHVEAGPSSSIQDLQLISGRCWSSMDEGQEYTPGRGGTQVSHTHMHFPLIPLNIDVL